MSKSHQARSSWSLGQPLPTQQMEYPMPNPQCSSNAYSEPTTKTWPKVYGIVHLKSPICCDLNDVRAFTLLCQQIAAQRSCSSGISSAGTASSSAPLADPSCMVARCYPCRIPKGPVGFHQVCQTQRTNPCALHISVNQFFNRVRFLHPDVAGRIHPI